MQPLVLQYVSLLFSKIFSWHWLLAFLSVPHHHFVHVLVFQTPAVGLQIRADGRHVPRMQSAGSETPSADEFGKHCAFQRQGNAIAKITVPACVYFFTSVCHFPIVGHAWSYRLLTHCSHHWHYWCFFQWPMVLL